ncbi:hypothetical protein G7046_g3733 [Stylonectria norvegica]|nr:hypothetical protein G7046_g3733 [Stylonectria norvegica]
MAVSNVWEKRRAFIWKRALNLLCVVVIYLTGELVIWGLSRALAPARLEFFASIVGMVLVFVFMSISYLLFRNCDPLYTQHVKSKIDFINAHLGVGFPIPLVMLNENNILSGPEIARIIANFVVTNLVSWTLIFGVSLAVIGICTQLRSKLTGSETPNAKLPQMESNSSLHDDVADREKGVQCATPDPESESAAVTSLTSSVTQNDMEHPFNDASRWWQISTSNFPILASFFCIFLIGAPVAAGTGEQRILDGCVLWFIWIASVRAQQAFKTSGSCPSMPRLKNALATLTNPVLLTTLLMTAYTRAKASAVVNTTLSTVLKIFSSGVPLYALWTSSASDTALPDGLAHWFGAGDLALSILEVGILVWGFKLYECRRQLFSVAGLLTVVISVIAAAANVFLSVYSGRSMGLHEAEALAFAARSTTLALAKPAMMAVGGNLGVNAALVVSNGIVGQLVYPFALGQLKMTKMVDSRPLPTNNDGNSGETVPDSHEVPRNDRDGAPDEGRRSFSNGDGPMTIATGITIGVNGAAMGVAYLYETKHRAAPYAALSMTVFGTMTVVFTTVEPFMGFLKDLASR